MDEKAQRTKKYVSILKYGLSYGTFHGHTPLFTTASHMLNEQVSQDGDPALQRKLKYYTQPQILIVDEVTVPSLL